MKRALALFVCAGIGLPSARADLLYENVNPDALNSFGNVDANAVMLDDVLIPTFRTQGMTRIDVKRVEVKLFSPLPGTHTVRAWFSPAFRTQNNTSAPTFPPTFIGSKTVTAGARNVTTLLAFGNGTDTLFSTDLLLGFYQNNPYMTFYFGLSFSAPLTEIGWYTADGPDANANSFFKYYGPNDPRNGITGFAGHSRNSFYIKLEGVPVPEPASALLLGVFALAGLRGRKR